MLKTFKCISVIALIFCAVATFALFVAPSAKTVAYAEENNTEITAQAETETPARTETKDNSKSSKAIAAAICVGLAAALGALSMGIAIAKSNEAIARQPEATSQIKSGLMLGLVFIETAIIYALIVAILVIFVL